MLKKVYVFIGIIFTFYLLLPGPKLPPKDLPKSLKSSFPGDTFQISNVSAYFTDESRGEVLDFYTNYFSKTSFFDLPLFTYRLNHRPEYAKQVWIDTKRSYYLEEIVHPLRESLFVNGFEWENDVFTPPGQRVQNKLIVGGKTWAGKVSLRWFYSSVLARVLIFWLAWGALYFLTVFWQGEIKAAFSLSNSFKKKK